MALTYATSASGQIMFLYDTNDDDDDDNDENVSTLIM